LKELKRTDLSVVRERAILFGIRSPKGNGRFDCDLEELERLAETAGAKVVGKVVQRTDRLNSTYFIGSGKAREIAELAKASGANVVISDSDLTSAQVRNLEAVLDAKVVDRTELILDIFATRAKTPQAKLQVELAQLEYLYPRLKNLWLHFSRFTGGIGARGPGEQQLEVDRRLVRKRIIELRRELASIEKRRERQVRKRTGFFTICIVGYTNAGKSTLMNALTEAGAFVEDKLFATLDTRTRLWSLPGRKMALLSDTVGFIKKLPHHLVSSFHATLEELRQADLLLHVVDIADGHAIQEVQAVERVLDELNCRDKPVLLVLNKVDKVTDKSDLQILQVRYPRSVAISALRRQGIEDLAEAVSEFIGKSWIEAEVLVEAGDGRTLAYLKKNAEVQSMTYGDRFTKVRMKADRVLVLKLEKLHGSERVKVLSASLAEGPS